MASASQPLLTLYQMNLSWRAKGSRLTWPRSNWRAEAQQWSKMCAKPITPHWSVKTALKPTEASIKQYEELDRISTQYVAEQVALKSELLEVKAKLAQEQLTLLKLRTSSRPRKTRSMILMGRDINTPFRTANVAPVAPAEEESWSRAEAKALAQNSDIKRRRHHRGKAERRMRGRSRKPISS